jgi:hypothetical protein
VPTSTKKLRTTYGSLALLGLAGALVLAACSAGGADSSLWDPGTGEPLDNGGESSTSGGASSSGNASSSGKTSSSSTSSSGKTSSSSSTSSTTSSAGGTVTWTQIYNTMFGPSGTSTCTGSSCHTGSRSGFACGNSPSSCWNGFVAAGYIDNQTPSNTLLVDPAQSCLCGSGLSGNMPKFPHSCLTSAQVSEIKSWIAAGAQNN